VGLEITAALSVNRGVILSPQNAKRKRIFFMEQIENYGAGRDSQAALCRSEPPLALEGRVSQMVPIAVFRSIAFFQISPAAKRVFEASRTVVG